MYTIALSIIAMMPRSEHATLRFAAGLMLMASHAATFGGYATPVGTPPNLMGLAFIQRFTGYHLSFLRWSLLALPIAAGMYGFLFLFLKNRSIGSEHVPIEVGSLSTGAQGFSRAEKSTIFAWTVTLTLWVAPGIAALILGEQNAVTVWLQRLFPESIAALIGMTLLLLLPGHSGKTALSLKEASAIDWEIVLLYATGFAFGVATAQTGLAGAIGKSLAANIPEVTPFVFLLGATCAAAFVSEFSSNTSSANIIVPVVISVAQAAGVDPVAPALGATFGASLGFMLPVSTPGNAIVYASGYVPLGKMMRYGIVLDIVGAIVIAVCIHLLFPLLR
jgi:sodium-dependent dicarboxylate transporter 2/3/5